MRVAGAAERVLPREKAGHLVGDALLEPRLIRDRGVNDRLDEVEGDHHREQLPDNLEAGSVLLEDEDQRDDQQHEQHEAEGPAVQVSRGRGRLHLVSVVGADIGAVTQVVACAPGRDAGAGAGCVDRRVQEGSALLYSSPWRYAGVVPLQNALALSAPSCPKMAGSMMVRMNRSAT